MNKQEAVKISQDTFNGGFDETQFTTFISNLFKNYEPLSANVAGGQLKEAFKPFVSHYKRIGKYTDAEGNAIDTIIVHLKKGSSLERARTAQRNFVAEYLKTRDKEAALVAFLSPDSSDWRLSLVKFETTFQHDEEKGKLKMVNETTPAKRWSFLIGENEGKHTVTSRFLDLLKSDVSPNLAELEAAFDVETVSEEFYEKYKELFLRMKDALDELVKKDTEIRADFEAKEISTVDFAKKTMGQMAFLYFLQKKGWFGVAPKAAWGTGRKDFLRDLFNKRSKLQVSHNLGINFFDDIMEPLFYDALASDRRDSDDFYNRLNCRMPFLNGGLFEPIQGYAWTTTHIRLPDELFSNSKKTKEGDTGDGILDVFDRYNFTVNESEPLEKEVAVDPEMLGKVFENLLEIKDRKSKGAYYTPREIVHYMCQQCLINHLETELREQSSITREDIEFLIQNGSRIIENDQMVIEKGRETEAYTFMLPESIRSEANHADELLASIKVCDPAVGSGAFPLGMLNEIIRARAALAVHQHQKIDYFELKKHTIINSLYGVDLDGGAVEIAKLRLWLALVVEEEEPHPLPNLECKIMQGNSLISQYEGITLFDETILEDIKSIETEKAEVTQRVATLQSRYFEVHGSELEQALKQEELKKIEKVVKGLKKRQQALSDPSTLSSEEMSLFSPPQERKIAHERSLKLQRLIKEYIETSHNKKTLKEEIENLKWELIEATLKEQGKAKKLDEIKALRKRHEKTFFIWKLEFSEVFRENGGFDVVIGNPPYGVKFSIPEKKSHAATFSEGSKIGDSYVYFILRGMQLSKCGGSLNYIVPNTFCDLEKGDDFRSYLLKNHSLLEIWKSGWAFESAVVDTIVFHLKNIRPTNIHEVLVRTAIEDYKKLQREFLNTPLQKIDFRTPKRLQEIRQSIRAEHQQVSEIFDIKAGVKMYEKGKGKPPQTKEIVSQKPYSTKNNPPADWPKLYRGGDVDRYYLSDNGERVNYGPWLAAPRSKDVFESPKILMRRTDDRLKSCIELESGIAVNSCHCIRAKSRIELTSYLAYLCVFNSSICQWMFEVDNPQMVGKTFSEIKVIYVERLSIPSLSKASQELLSKLAVLMLHQVAKTHEHKDLLESLIESCVMECYFREHMAERDLLVHEAVAEALWDYNPEAPDSAQVNYLETVQNRLIAARIPERLERIPEASPDLLAVILNEGAI